MEKILFGVLELGLGHATRDIVLITELLKKHEVHIISSGKSLELLKKTFCKKCKYYEIKGFPDVYNSRYFFKLNYFISLKKIMKIINSARNEVNKIIEKNKFDKIISDCRVDVYDKVENSYFINHQLRFASSPGIEKVIEKILAYYMKHYNIIIVPDFKTPNLSGKLSHNLHFIPEEKIKYIGILSHLKKKNEEKTIDYFISLSGPNKTKEQLLKQIIKQLHYLKGNIVITGGNINFPVNITQKNVSFYPFLERDKQEEIMNKSKFVIIRAGYTTIMELIELEKSALLIPSPGQPEQEYLCKYLKNYFLIQKQSNLNLKVLINLKNNNNKDTFETPWKTMVSVEKFLKIINF